MNLGWLAAERAVRLVLNVGVGFWVARYLGPVRFGALSYAMAVVGIAALLAELGLDGVVRRELIQQSENSGPLIATAWRLRLVGGAIAWSLLVVSGLSGWASEREQALFAVLGLTLFQPSLLVVDLWFQATLRAKYSVLAQLVALAVGAGVRVALIAMDAPLVGFAWAAVVELAVASVLMLMLARRQGLAWRIVDFDGAKARRLLREAWPLMLSGLAVIVYLRVDAVMLRALSGEAAVGLYAAATRFTEIWFFVPVTLASSTLPALLRAKARGGQEYEHRLQAYFDVSAALAYVLAVPLALSSPWVVRVAYGVAYADAAPVLALHIWSSVFIFLGVARGQFLVNEGHSRFYLAATLAGLVVNVVLNAWLIPRQGPWGAALATLMAQATAAWLSTFCFAPVRRVAWMQTRALFLPVTWFRYFRRA